jgi:hypothetical protein
MSKARKTKPVVWCDAITINVGIKTVGGLMFGDVVMLNGGYAEISLINYNTGDITLVSKGELGVVVVLDVRPTRKPKEPGE